MKVKTTLIAVFALVLALPATALAAPKAKMRFSAATYVNAESGNATITVTRQPRKGKSQASYNQAVTVNYATSAGSAGPADYTDVSGTLDFAAGQVTKTFVVPITQDADIEGPETVRLSLTAPSRQAAIVNPSTATLTIADDDGPVQLHYSAPSYSVSEFGPAAEITVVRTGQLRDAGGNAVTSTVDYATADGTAGAADYNSANGTLTFGADDVEETILVPVKQDSAIEGPEGFSVSLSNPTNAVFANGNPTLTAQVTIVDDDTASGQPELVVEPAAYTGAENGGGIAVTVVRNGPVNTAVTVFVQTVAGTATADVDFTSLNDEIEFGEGDLTQTFVVPVIDDSADEADETLSVQLASVDGGAIGSPATAALTILDDDEQPVVVDTPDEQQPAPQDPAPAPVVNVTNSTTTVTNTTFVNPLAAQAGIMVLGERIGSCRLNIGTFKSQRIVRAKLVRVKLHAVEACTGSVKSHVKGRKSLRGVKKGALQTKVVKFTLKAGQSKTIKMRFTKRGYKFLKRALGKQRTLSAALLVRSTNAAKRVTLNTLRFKAKR